ncbi:MAG: FkbM family methyltransferase [Alphaproteobacteria bacterium]|nr:FkbM family methyltransferase [Alphaproteobacteria bacterium]
MLRRLNRLVRTTLRPPAIARMPEFSTPPALSVEERVDLATQCRDCDLLPKVADAGTVISDVDGARVQVMHNGLKMLADGYCGAWMTDLIGRCQGHHEPQEERVFHEVVARMPPGATMIELGAWWSFYSLWFLQGHPGRQALALEPDPERRALGEANAARNALAPRFVDGFVGATSLAAARFRLDSGYEITIPRRSVPDLLTESGFAALDLLHCDAQGAEYDVLTSCAELMQTGRIRTLIVSTHHHSISGDPLTHQRCMAVIEQCGGLVFAEHDVQESYSGDGLIAARFGPDQAAWPIIPLSLNRYSTSLFRNPLFDLADVMRS